MRIIRFHKMAIIVTNKIKNRKKKKINKKMNEIFDQNK